MKHYAFSIPKNRIEKIEIIFNERHKTLADLKRQYQADYILTGTLYNMSTQRPVCHLKRNGVVYSQPPYTVRGYAWNTPEDFRLDVLPYASAKNYIACTPLIQNGKKISNLTYAEGQGGKRGRAAIGTKYVNGEERICVYCSQDGSGEARTPEELRDLLYAYGWYDCVMLDGGASAQCDFQGKRVRSSRRLPHYIIIKLKKETKNMNNTENMTPIEQAEEVKGWTEKEMQEGFQQPTEEVYTLPAKVDFSRRPDLAGTVQIQRTVGGIGVMTPTEWEVHYDEDGYAIKAINLTKKAMRAPKEENGNGVQ